MLNLALVAARQVSLDLDGSVSCFAFEPDQHTFLVGSENDGVVFVSRCLPESQQTRELASCPGNGILSMKILEETRTLVLILKSGEIASLSLDEDQPELNIIGEVEHGIQAISWSPDDALFVLITGKNEVVLMNSSFETLWEGPVDTDEFGADAQANVGWGSKSTQFHGSLGKAAASTSSSHVEAGSSPDDDGVPRVSWRGDGAYFAVSSFAPVSTTRPLPRRFIRIFDSNGILQSTGEPVAGLEHTLSWRPSGNLITSSQRFGEERGLGKGKKFRHDIVFFERNGLRHGEFTLPIGRWRVGEKDLARTSHKIKEMAWNADSTVLALWISTQPEDIVQLWTTGNYHWYLKQEIGTSQGKKFSSIAWHPEDPLRIAISTECRLILERTFQWEIFRASPTGAVDSGMVAVIDGENIGFTAFRVQNVPPPMAAIQYKSQKNRFPPLFISFCHSEQDLAVILWGDGYTEVIQMHTNFGDPLSPVLSPVLVWSGQAKAGIQWRAVAIQEHSQDSSLVVFLGSNGEVDELHVKHIQDGVCIAETGVELPQQNGRLIESSTPALLLWQSPEGEVKEIDAFGEKVVAGPKAQALFVKATKTNSLLFGLTTSSELLAMSPEGRHLSLATKVNSFILCPEHIILTTTAQEALFPSLDVIKALLEEENPTVPRWESRRVERGSRIITSVPSTMSLVLQMPRGNLETIYPRPLVLKNVSKRIDMGDYWTAFLACRKHRVDLNVIVEHDYHTFVDAIPLFLQQIEDPDHINLFLSGIGRTQWSAQDIATVCDAVRLGLENKGFRKYINSILTAHVVKHPPDYEAALNDVSRLPDSSEVEDAVKYLIFLADTNKLFDTALGMYNMPLVLLIGQNSQMDPREYLPFLRELSSLEQFYQRYCIDKRLKRHEAALQNIKLAGKKYFDEATSFIKEHNLYLVALDVWKDGAEEKQKLSGLYGDWLFERREFEKSALAFSIASEWHKSVVAYEKALLWREVFQLIADRGLVEFDASQMASRLGDSLATKQRYLEASQVVLDYCDDVPRAVQYLVQGNQISEAKRLAWLYDQLDLMADVIVPAVLHARLTICDDLKEMEEQFEKERSRISELRQRREVDPDAFYGLDESLHEVDATSEVSTPFTTFTRYTVAQSAISKGTSKRSQKLKRRSERKKGRKGTVEEEEYLLASITRLATRLSLTAADARNLIPHLLAIPDCPRADVIDLQDRMSKFLQQIREGVEEIWLKHASETVEAPINPRDKYDKPTFDEFAWPRELLTA